MKDGRRQIGYCKLGRSIVFDPKKYGFQGDAEAPQLLRRLAKRNPDVDWIVVGKNTRNIPDQPPNVVNPWDDRPTGEAWGFADKLAVYMGTLDGVVVQHGQSGTSHHAIPQSNSTWADYYDDPLKHATTPQDWGCSYAGFLIKGMNILGDKTNGEAPIVWIVPDPRNYVKARDVKWPSGTDDILAQYQYSRDQRHERWRDPRPPTDFGLNDIKTDRDGEIWVVRHQYRYGGLELMILPDDWPTWMTTGFAERQPAGIATTSFKDQLSQEPRRSQLVKRYLLEAWPDAEVFGKWDKESLKDVPPGRVTEAPPTKFVEQLNRWRVTLALPALGSSWTAAKPWQCFAAGVVCFHVGRLDDQGWVLPSRRETEGTSVVGEVNDVKLYSVRDDWTEADLHLAAWLRVETADEFTTRSRAVASDEETWRWLAGAQRVLLQRRWDEHYLETEIERKLGL